MSLYRSPVIYGRRKPLFQRPGSSGRPDHALLEQNKFLMVTGASGEGKSSLIYAGLIPNARAGFFKAKYTNWVVADFRPESNPVSNMADSLAETI